MYNFQITKERKEELLNNICFTKKEKEIFLLLTSGMSRKEIPKYQNYCLRTVQYKVKDICKKIRAYDQKINNYSDNYVYMHIFPNNKKYVGNCKNCDMRWGNNGNGNGFFGGNSFDNGYAWLSNGQKEIMQNTNNGFDTLHLSNQLDTINSGIYSLSNQLCNCCADMNSTVSNGFYNAEIGANNRQMANMNQIYGLSTQLATASADNRLGIANLNSTILSENCADRAALADGLKDVLINQTANTQRILDQLCNDKIDAKNEKILDLQRQLDMADLKASQIAQNAFISQGFANEVDQLYNRLSNCPVPSTPVYGRTPIFTCPNNNGCGCNGYATNII